MESGEPSQSLYRPDARPTAIRVDIVKSEDQEAQLSPASSLASPATPSEVGPAGRRFASCSPEMACPPEPSRGPRKCKSATSIKGDREKRKRSRVTQDQLVHLEQFFAEDRIPTAARRKEISQFLGMQERQTQIWFQNRRAKAKLQDSKKAQRDELSERFPDSPPDLRSAEEHQLESVIHEDEAITIIPCMELNIGWWRRIANAGGTPDLVAYICEGRRCLTWFVHTSDRGFKIEIPFDSIVDSQFSTAAPGTAIASFFLSQAPLFFTENVLAPTGPAGASPVRSWQASTDWTEGMQASSNLRHDLVGSVAVLANLVRRFHMSSPGSGIQLTAPYGVPDESAPQSAVAPAIADAPSAGDLHHEETPRPEYAGRTRKRSFSGPPILSASLFELSPGVPQSAPQHLDPRVSALLGPPSTSSSLSSPRSQYSRGSPYSSTYHTPVTPDYPLPGHGAEGPYHCSSDGSCSAPQVVSPISPPDNSFFSGHRGSYDSHAGLGTLSSLSMDPYSHVAAHPPSSPILTTPLHWAPRGLAPDVHCGSVYDEPAFVEPLAAHPPDPDPASPYWTSHYVQYQNSQ
ncbi:hypothetical protein GLOTRDRAFT_62830 [Gloeophyllum trabeum ATCC 11539]|uniref:Homeobox domain-containing protein n=1 Tax=Gloeophyllum trabeum (strain ATCC 11539 / FP-39264 / Madison 617) TaxID=670483 RepID=S7Q2R6_GLOTA|nr:uncharacterized protein GLOTRDRAFT_62830 [Gloeophyllum trabeum ATCC 11539]EPQ54286.1 hypothetical protein GLOTRDRAFT_62830 [Gloeophyllum trabeum ATCC 11539]